MKKISLTRGEFYRYKKEDLALIEEAKKTSEFLFIKFKQYNIPYSNWKDFIKNNINLKKYKLHISYANPVQMLNNMALDFWYKQNDMYQHTIRWLYDTYNQIVANGENEELYLI